MDFHRILVFLPGIILGLTVHEFSHAFIAHQCGDSTSRDQGRITLNPLKHIDVFGFLMILVAGFGWAKPVQFNEENLRNPKSDVIKIAAAGPLSNALLAMLLSVVFVISGMYGDYYQNGNTNYMVEIFISAIFINWGLFIFNLIPLPPLDGSHLVFNSLKKYPALYDALYKYGSLLLLGLLIATAVTKINLLPIWPLVQYLGSGFISFLGSF
jgi:Zn-dependent protease